MSKLSQLKAQFNTNRNLNINGIAPDQWLFLYQSLLDNHLHSQKNQVFIFPTEKQASEQAVLDPDSHYYPGLSHSPYSAVISSEYDFIKRVKILTSLHQNKSLKIYCSYHALFLNSLGHDFFNKKESLTLSVEDIISPEDLAKKLIQLGYQFSSQVHEAGDFSKRGEIFDIYPFSHPPIRLQYFDDLIEHIYEIDPNNQRTLKDKPIQKISIIQTPRILIADHFIKNFKAHFPRPELKFNPLNDYRDQIFNDLNNGKLFTNYSLYAHLFTKNPLTLYDHLQHSETLFTIFNKEECLINHHELLDEIHSHFEDLQNDLTTQTPLLAPNLFYQFKEINQAININQLSTQNPLENQEVNIQLSFEPSLPLFTGHKSYLTFNNPKNRYQFLKNICDLIKHQFSHMGKIIFLIKYAFSKEEILNNLKENNINPEVFSRITVMENLSCQGFYDSQENLLVISETDFLTKKKKNNKNLKESFNQDYFSEQMSQLQLGDYVIHAEFGVGQYRGLEKLKYGENEADFLVIDYHDNDKVYVPVYKINLVQKHADSNTIAKLDSLRSKKFSQAKDKAKKAAKELAFDLIELQAKRKMEEGFAFSPSSEEYKNFELDFPYTETYDQARAIENVISDMEKDHPMDRLICGDVGFGKTEVAMRAAFKAVLDNKQVAILVPTTILSLQHYNSFKERFKNFPINIEFLSRLKSPKESKIIIQKLQEGKVDIIIGTHKLLGKEIKYHDLGLVIIDEEHRFGVAHKEKLKLLKATVDILTLTATPIPRTMQLAQLGLRDISTIQTPPPRRQSVKTFLIREDKATIKEAIERELSRGGQVYFIHNRVNDIELIHRQILEMIPTASIVIAHGQLPEKELAKRIQKFYQKEAQILLATTIVESGIDIPMANTLIINKADRFGLAQLHQLRGRIGRSDRKAYAYFVIGQNKKLGEIAQRRLKTLQTFSEMGSGFSISSSDLDIRGAGNILGAKQSGHIASIGLELYLELMQEAIHELKGRKEISIQNIEIQTYFPSYIPASDIKDHGQRLRYYKKLSRCQTLEALNENKEEIIDLYGQLSPESLNLMAVFEGRILAKKIFLQSVKVNKNKIILNFNQQLLESYPEKRDTLIEYFLSRPNTFKMQPNFCVHCHIKTKENKNIDKDIMVHFISSIAEQI